MTWISYLDMHHRHLPVHAKSLENHGFGGRVTSGNGRDVKRRLLLLVLVETAHGEN